MRSGHFIKSIEKTFSVLEIISSSKVPISLTDIATSMHAPVGSIFRYTYTLLSLGYIKQDHETKKYSLSPKFLKLSSSSAENNILRKRILPYMIELSENFNVSSQCGVLEVNELVYIHRVRSKNIVNLDLSAGSHLPLYCSAIGKVLLAFTPREITEKIIDEMEFVQLAPNTITSKQSLVSELEKIRETGFATSSQELVGGLYSLAVPIFSENRIEASLGISQFYDFKESDSFDSILNKMRLIAERVSL